MNTKLMRTERNGWAMYLGYNNWHVEKTIDSFVTREFDSYEDARSFFNLMSQRGNR